MIPGIPYRYAGVPSNGISAVMRIAIGGSPTTGGFKLTLGQYTTALIAWSATNGTLTGNVQAAVRALANVNGANVTVTDVDLSSGIGHMDCTFTGDLAALYLPVMTVASNTLDGSGTVAVTSQTDGVTATFRNAPTGTEVLNTSTGDIYVNSGTSSPNWTLSTAVYGFPSKRVSLGSPSATSNTAVHAAIALTSSTQSVNSGFTAPDVPRVLIVKGNASGNAGNVTVHGTDAADAVITETFALNGSSAVTGLKAFKTVTSVDLPAETHSGTDTVSIGLGAGIGLGFKLAQNTVLMAFLGGARESTAPTVAVSSSTLALNVITLNSSVNGTAVLAYYIADVTP